MCLEIQHGEEGVGVRLVAVDLDGAAQQRLREDQVGKLRKIEELGVDVEKLAQQRLEPVEVDGGLRVEPLKVDIDRVHVLCAG